MKAKSQRGVALVITLIMVAIITLLAVSFLALSRRDQGSISVSQSDTVSKLAAQAAEAHAQAEILARVIAATNMFAAYTSFTGYSNFLDSAAGVLVSTNIDIAGLPGNRLSQIQYVRGVAGLQMDARPPVFIKHLAAGGKVTEEERFYLDFNRNGFNERPGWNPLNNSYYSGDPEWIGILEHPEFVHSATNRFVARYAYLVLPVGNSLDLNYIHNFARGASPSSPGSAMTSDGFSRNQGVGGWEVNLGAFLQDLAPDFYPTAKSPPTAPGYVYNVSGGGAATTGSLPFQHAVEMLQYRLNQNYNNLLSVNLNFNNNVGKVFQGDLIDSYSIYPILTPPFRNTTNFAPGLFNAPWVGSPSPNRFVDMQDFFTKLPGPAGPSNFTNVLFNAGQAVGPAASPDDRYLLYRLLSQLSSGSEPDLKGKINLNFTNDPTQNTSQTTFSSWAATNFFRLAGQAILQANMITNLGTTNFFLGGPPGVGLSVAPSFGVDNIEIYPNNQYTPLVHQLLQVAANLYDSACTNRVYPRDTAGVAFPTVFRPVLARSGTRIYIKDWVEVGDASTDPTVGQVMNPAVNFVNPDPNSLQGNLSANPYVYGLPWIIGARKGFPNFNELAISTAIFAERKLEMIGPTAGTAASGKLTFLTNQMYLLGFTNTYCVEGWNSYTNTYPNNSTPHTLRMTMVMQTTVLLTNAAGVVVWPANHIPYTTNFSVVTNITSWKGGTFFVPLSNAVTLLPTSIYTPLAAGATTAAFTPYNSLPLFNNALNNGFPPLQLYLVMTNSFRYAVEDVSVVGAGGRLVDFVTFSNLSAVIDIGSDLAGTASSLPGEIGASSAYGQYWQTNLIGGPNPAKSPTRGVFNQVQSSTGASPPPDNADPHWASEVSNFNLFLAGSLPSASPVLVPYAPSRFIVNTINYEVNDPLVHFMVSDITDPVVTNSISYPSVNALIPPPGTIGGVNKHYKPWGVTTAQINMALQDPGVFNSDSWDFPTNRFPNVGWIGRVHRGTPWQTIYLKSAAAAPTDWYQWAGTLSTHPTNDWRLVDLFTTALNDNAASGLLPVNQQGLAAWSAVLSGVIALTNAPSGLQALVVQPASVSNPANPGLSPVAQIVASINATRAAQPGGSFQTVGQILQTPALASFSPFVNGSAALSSTTPANGNWINDEAYERLPGQILSLLRLGQPRFAIYSYGQSLKPADGSYVLDSSLLNTIPGAFNVSTNYQITGEAAYRTVFRLEGNPLRPNVVIESYTPLAPE